MKKLLGIILLSLAVVCSCLGLIACGECEHSFTNYVSDNNATCTADGTKTATCDKDGCEEKDTITDTDSKLEHSFTNYVSDNNATCLEDGTKTATCDNGCGVTDTIVDEGSKTNHILTKVQSVEATCKKEGHEEYYVCVCGKLFADDEGNNEIFSIPTTIGHDFQLKSLITNETEISCPGVFECTNCHYVKTSSVTYDDIGIPILLFDGDITTMTKENEVLLGVEYQNDEQIIKCDATVKWQGASSINYPKKNYTMKLLKKGTEKKNKVEMKEGWGEQSKYCLKANYVDFSQARNVVSGQLYSQIVKSRDLNDEIEQLTNGGAVDGFPILIYINGTYQGLYTLNIPKDKWMFGMEDDESDDGIVTKQALLMGDHWGNGTALNDKINNNYASCGFELEYCSTEDTIGDDWVVESFNAMIDFINNNDGEDFKNGISNYVCLERTIDSMLFTWFINAGDNRSKNILWTTYDGVHWFSSMYDMDGTWGILWNGAPHNPETNNFWNEGALTNVLWAKIWKNFEDEITERYFELREDILSAENIKKQFKSFLEVIPTEILNSEKEKWSSVPSINCSSYEYICTFTDNSIYVLDTYFNAIN